MHLTHRTCLVVSAVLALTACERPELILDVSGAVCAAEMRPLDDRADPPELGLAAIARTLETQPPLTSPSIDPIDLGLTLREDALAQMWLHCIELATREVMEPSPGNWWVPIDVETELHGVELSWTVQAGIHPYGGVLHPQDSAGVVTVAPEQVVTVFGPQAEGMELVAMTADVTFDDDGRVASVSLHGYDRPVEDTIEEWEVGEDGVAIGNTSMRAAVSHTWTATPEGGDAGDGSDTGDGSDGGDTGG